MGRSPNRTIGTYVVTRRRMRRRRKSTRNQIIREYEGLKAVLKGK
jgi:hypothetical protein